MNTRKASEKQRNWLITGGIALALFSQLFAFGLSIFMYLISVSLLLNGCYIWTQIKNRHWAFMFWGLIAPIGLLGISLLKDNSDTVNQPESDQSQS